MPENAVYVTLSADDYRLLQSLNKIGVGFKGMETAVVSSGVRGQRAGKELERAFAPVSNVLGNISREAVAMVGGLMTISAATGAAKEYLGYLSRIRDGIIEINKESVALQKQMLSFAEQKNLPGREGLMAVTGEAAALANIGGIPIPTAKVIGEKAASIRAMPEPVQAEVSRLIAQLIGKTGGEADEGAAMVELFGAAKVQTTEQAKKYAAQTLGAMLATVETNTGKFGLQAIKGTVAALSLGLPFKEALAATAQSRAVAGESEATSELTRQAIRDVTVAKEGLAIIQKELGLKTPDEARVLPPEKQLAAMQSAIQKARTTGGDPAVKMLLKKFPGRQQEQLQRFFSPAAIAAGEEVRRYADAMTVRNMEALFAKFAETDVARAQVSENEKLLRRAQAAHKGYGKAQLLEDSRARLKEIEAAGKLSWIFQKLTPDIALENYAGEILQLERLGAPNVRDWIGFNEIGKPTSEDPARQLAREKARRRWPAETVIGPGGVPTRPSGEPLFPAPEPAPIVLPPATQPAAGVPGQMQGGYIPPMSTPDQQMIGHLPMGSFVNIVYGDVYGAPGPGPELMHPAAAGLLN